MFHPYYDPIFLMDVMEHSLEQRVFYVTREPEEIHTIVVSIIIGLWETFSNLRKSLEMWFYHLRTIQVNIC